MPMEKVHSFSLCLQSGTLSRRQYMPISRRPITFATARASFAIPISEQASIAEALDLRLDGEEDHGVSKGLH